MRVRPNTEARAEAEGLLVTFGAAAGVALDRDIVIDWPVAGLEPGTTLDMARPASGHPHHGTAHGLLTASLAAIRRDGRGTTMTDNAKQTIATVIPTLRYRDAPAAIEWLCRAFGSAMG